MRFFSGGGLFGSAGTSTFGTTPAQPSGGLFGGSGTTQQQQQQQQSGGLFGNMGQSNTSFGQQPAQTGTTGGLFGSSTGTSFGQPAQNTTGGGLFGSNQASTGGGLFGKPATSTGSAFNFGSNTNSNFGAAASTGGGLFGSNAAKPAGGGFFGANTGTAGGGGLFGSSQPSTGGGLFGSTQPTQNTGTGGGLFSGMGVNQQQQQAQSGFGAIPMTTQVAMQQTPIILGSDVNQTQLEMKLIEAQLAASPYGDSPLLKIISAADDTPEKPNPASAQRQLRFMASKMNRLAEEKDKPLTVSNAAGAEKNSPLMSAVLSPTKARSGLDSADDKRAANLSGNQLVKSQFMGVLPPKIMEKSFRAASVIPVGSAEDLKYTSIVRPPTLGKGIGTRPQSTSFISSKDASMLNSSATALSPGGNQLPSILKKTTTNVKYLDLSVLNGLDSSMNSTGGGARGRKTGQMADEQADPDAIQPLRPNTDNPSNIQEDVPHTLSPVSNAIRRAQRLRDAEPPVLNLDDTSASASASLSAGRRSPAANAESTQSHASAERTTSSRDSHISHDNLLGGSTRREDAQACGVRLLQPDYFCEPSIEQMKSMIHNGAVSLPDGLTIGRASYGTVYWPGPIQIKDIVLDELVVFRHKEVTVYPDEAKKPPVGEGLNRPAEVTLERVWKRNRITGEYVKDPIELTEIGWREFLERQTSKMSAEFKDYRPLTGSWVFRVEHFSKYGLSDDEDVENQLVGRVKKGRILAAQNGAQGDVPTTDELEKSFEEREVQNKVQRAKITSKKDANADCLMEFQMQAQYFPDGEGADLMVLESLVNNEPMESEQDDEILMENQMKRGLAKLEDLGRHRQPLSVDPNSAPKSYDFLKQLEAIIPPQEKKPKLEEIEDLYTQTEILLHAMAAQKLAISKERNLKQIAPVHQFTGGYMARNSVSYNASRRMDFGVAMGNAARIGWGSVAGVQVGQRFVVSRQPGSNEVAIGHIHMNSDTNKAAMYDMMLKTLSNSTWNRTTETTARPIQNSMEKHSFVPQTVFKQDCFSVLLKEYANTARDNNSTLHSRTFSLCSALLPFDKKGPWRSVRAERLGHWMRQEIQHATLNRSIEKSNARGASVWRAMCSGDLEEAIRKAEEERLTHLASFLAAYPICPDTNRKEMQAQLDHWSKSDTLQYMDKDVLKVYMILAGRTSLERIVRSKKETVNCMEGLDWKQCLGLHLWWTRGAGSLEDAYERYRNEVTAGQAANSDGHFYEELIHLACNPAHRIETVLDALMYLSSNSINDLCLSWFVWSLLRTYGYNSMAAENLDRLHRQFAVQLESHKAVGPALFVLSHLDSHLQREKAMRDLIVRQAYEIELNLSLEDEINKFCPHAKPAWLAEARCIVARARGESAKAFEYAIQAEDYELARELYVKEVAPDCIFYLKAAELRRYSRMIENVADKIKGFSDYGQLFVDYSQLKAAAHPEELNQDGAEQGQQDQNMIDCFVLPNSASYSIFRHCISTISRELYEIKASLLDEHDFSLPFESATNLMLMGKLADQALFD
ncbi:hypothetical protein WR25_06016 isoform B [Diploscapter pachys]|uniref:Nuclear pore complex protein Nup98-Nup96 n=1 Tax=Diploscapter pachys TaxID=2018661 RepID=A0A2A2LQC8_9BILA|nr:hypothetical protein WR25_06016 isoform B [Diploscapter pachys]